MTSVVFGASSGLGRALAEQLASNGHDLVLIARDKRDLEALKNDIVLRHACRVDVMPADLMSMDHKGFSASLLNVLGGPPENVFMIAGASSPVEDTVGAAEGVIDVALGANFVSPVKLINEIAPGMARRGSGNIVGVGSVASARGRRKNLHYATAKTALEFFFQGLRHYLADTGVHIQFYRFGYIDTSMTFGQSLPFPVLSPEMGAKMLISGLDRDIERAYLPSWWRYICWVLQMVPWPVFKKLDI